MYLTFFLIVSWFIAIFSFVILSLRIICILNYNVIDHHLKRKYPLFWPFIWFFISLSFIISYNIHN
jgi:hypothetical protein